MKNYKAMLVGMGFVLAYCSSLAASQFNVDCNTGQTLSNAVDRAKKDDTIIVTGVCDSAITITQNGLSIVGDNAVLSVSGNDDAISVLGAQRVSLSNLTIRQGSRGVVLDNGASVAVDNITIELSGSTAIELSGGSHLALSDVWIKNSGLHGINLSMGSGISVVSNLTIESVGAFGVNAESLSTVLANDAMINVHGSRAMGIHMVTGSNLFINNSTFDASRNVLRGISVNSGAGFFAFNSDVIANNTLALDGMAFANAVVDVDRNASLTANHNRRDGIVIESSTLTSFIFPPVNGPVITANENGRHGIRTVLGGRLEIKAGSRLEASNNAVSGILIDDGSGANLRNAEILDNGVADITLSFASRLDTISGNNIGILQCDTTVASRGQYICP